MMKFTAALIAVAGVAEATRFKSGAVTGYEKFTYGKFITRMKAPNKKGTVSSFFTYWNGPDFYPGGWNELDVEIVPSVSQNPFSMNAIYGDGHKKHESHDYRRDFDPADDWHIYEMAWTPEYIAWSVDNKEVRRMKTDDPAVEALSKGQSVMMNFWTPTFESWGKGFNAEDMPWYVLYDYVETYTWNSHTSGFDFHWRDDFITFDANRWHKSDNTTFDANSTTFRASQSYIDSGHLVLKMEPDQPQVMHHGQHYEPTKVIPVETEPAYEHKAGKDQKVKPGDEHYDVLAEQHYSHEAHAEHPHFRGGFESYSDLPHGYPYGEPMLRHHAGDPYYSEEDVRSYYGGEHGYERQRMHHTDPYAATEAYHHSAEHYAPHHEIEQIHEGAEAVGAHLDQHHVEADPVHHAAAAHHVAGAHHAVPLVHETMGPHDAQPIHAASTEPHVSSTPSYYDEMFGGHRDGIPAHHAYRQYEGEHLTREAHYADNEADNLAVHGIPELTHLDQTPYEHQHSDYDSRYLEHDVVPHHEAVHDTHGLQHGGLFAEVVDMAHTTHHKAAIPSYGELLWAYQHGGVHSSDYHHRPEREYVHHEDSPVEIEVLDGGEHAPHGYEGHHADYPLFDAHMADQEYVMDHGDQHPTPHWAEHDREYETPDYHVDDEPQYYHEDRDFENPQHHQGRPFWRGDHYDDGHKTDEDVRHDSEAHHYHAGDAYGHDTNYHQGSQLMHDIEHQYDELFHEIEAETKHGVEHHDVTYKTLPLHRKEHDDDPVASTFHAGDAHFDEHVDTSSEDHHHAYQADAHSAEHEHVYQSHDHRYAAPAHVEEQVHQTHEDSTHYTQENERHFAREHPDMYSWAVAHEDDHRTIAERYGRHRDDRYHETMYHDPEIHGDHDTSEYHELTREPFHGDVAHGDLHFEPLVKGEHKVVEPHHTIAYPPAVEAPHHLHEAPVHAPVHAPVTHHEAPAAHHEAPSAHHAAGAHDAPQKTSTPPTTAKKQPVPAAPKASPKAAPQQPAVAKKLESNYGTQHEYETYYHGY